MIEEKARKVKLLIVDVDGVLTDGRIIYDNFGDEFKCFHVQDGLGFVLLGFAKIKSVIITAKKSRIVARRAREMGIAKVCQNAPHKLKAYNKILKAFKVSDDEVCFIGDDIIDMPVLRRVGLAVGVANAMEEVKKISHYITKKEGGKGAVREVVDLILKAQGKWDELVGRY